MPNWIACTVQLHSIVFVTAFGSAAKLSRTAASHLQEGHRQRQREEE